MQPNWRNVGIASLGLYILYVILRPRKRADLKNKVVVITGASSGLGKACAVVFHMAGCKVILCGRRSEELEKVKKELELRKMVSHQIGIVVFDICKFSDMESVVEKITQIHGRIDILVNNAGISYRGRADETILDVDQNVMAVNYFGQIALTKAVLPVFSKQGGGHVVAISSIQGKLAIPYRTAYAASKHALQAFFTSLRAEMAGKNVKVTIISPSYINTNLSLNAVCSDGSTYGTADKTLLTGMSAEYAAKKVYDAVARSTADVTIGPVMHKMAAYAQALVPNILCSIMVKRARKEASSYRKRD